MGRLGSVKQPMQTDMGVQNQTVAQTCNRVNAQLGLSNSGGDAAELQATVRVRAALQGAAVRRDLRGGLGSKAVSMPVHGLNGEEGLATMHREAWQRGNASIGAAGDGPHIVPNRAPGHGKGPVPAFQ